MGGRQAGRIIAYATVGLGLLGLLVAGGVHAQGRVRLQSRLDRAKQEAAAARRDLVEKRERAAHAENRLVRAQQELAAAEARLARARRQLAQTRRELADTRLALDRARKRLAVHQAAMQRRLLAVFRGHDPTLAEVLLRSTSFEDLATRAEFGRRLSQCDQSMLLSIVDDKTTIEREERRLEEKEAELEGLKARVAKERVAVAEKAAEARRLAIKAQQDVQEAERQLAAMEAEIRSIAAMLRSLATRRVSSGAGHHYSGSWSGSFHRPVPGAVTSGYGWRTHPITGTRRFHDGIDLACSGGTPIECAADGTVISTGWRGPYGLTVIVDHGSGVATMYAHCQRGSIEVSPGQRVSRGQVLARVDSTGWSTGNHLHWTVFKNGEHVNPFSM